MPDPKDGAPADPPLPPDPYAPEPDGFFAPHELAPAPPFGDAPPPEAPHEPEAEVEVGIEEGPAPAARTPAPPPEDDEWFSMVAATAGESASARLAPDPETERQR